MNQGKFEERQILLILDSRSGRKRQVATVYRCLEINLITWTFTRNIFRKNTNWSKMQAIGRVLGFKLLEIYCKI